MHAHNTVTSNITCVCGMPNVEICIICYEAIHGCQDKGGV